MRVTKDRVAASRARLHDGQEAPVSCRPRTRTGVSNISQHLGAGNRLPRGIQFTGCRGPRAARKVAWILSAEQFNAYRDNTGGNIPMSDLIRVHCLHCQQTYFTTDAGVQKCDLCRTEGGLVSPDAAIALRIQ